MEEVVIRLRISAQEAHYGGNLVDGARMLGLFGDVATELLIRLDGDEGLFGPTIPSISWPLYMQEISLKPAAE